MSNAMNHPAARRTESIMFIDRAVPVTIEERGTIGNMLSGRGIDMFSQVSADQTLWMLAEELRKTQEELRERNRNGLTVTQAQEELDAFKKRVAEVAMRYAKQHDWCDVVQLALAELGIEYKEPNVKATIVVEFDLEQGVSAETLEHFERNPLDYIRRSVSSEPGMALDGDFNGHELDPGRIVEVRVTGDV